MGSCSLRFPQARYGLHSTKARLALGRRLFPLARRRRRSRSSWRITQLRTRARGGLGGGVASHRLSHTGRKPHNPYHRLPWWGAADGTPGHGPVWPSSSTQARTPAGDIMAKGTWLNAQRNPGRATLATSLLGVFMKERAQKELLTSPPARLGGCCASVQRQPRARS